MSIDFNKVGLLLHVVAEARAYPSFSAINDLAMAELAKINIIAVKDLMELRGAEKRVVEAGLAKAAEERAVLAQQRVNEEKAQVERDTQAKSPTAQNFTQPKVIPNATPLMQHDEATDRRA